MELSSGQRREYVYQVALDSYGGDPMHPDWAFAEPEQRRRKLYPVIEPLRAAFKIVEFSNLDDGVSLSFELTEKRGWFLRDSSEAHAVWTLWLSAAAPVALLVEGRSDVKDIRRDDVMSDESKSTYRSGQKIIDTIHAAGFSLLSAEDVEATVIFKAYQEGFPVTLFVMLFEEEEVPWWT